MALSYQQGESMKSISKKYGCDRSVVKNALKHHDVIQRSQSAACTIYDVDEEFFSQIDTPETAYVYGLFCADGSLVKNRFKISLNAIDFELLEDVKWIMKYTGPLYFEKNMTTLSVVRSALASDLRNLGIMKNKTFTLRFPDIIPRGLMNHFIRGYFDGDGSIFKTSATQKWVFSVTSNVWFLNGLKSFLEESCPMFSCSIFPYQNRNPNIANLVASSKQSIIAIQEYLYKDCTICLDRKRTLFTAAIISSKSIRAREITYGIPHTTRIAIINDPCGATEAASKYNVSRGTVYNIRRL